MKNVCKNILSLAMAGRLLGFAAPARRGYLGLFLAALVASPLLVMSDHALAWQTEINGTANSTDRVLSVAVDAGGNVIAGGFIVNSGTGRDFAVVKLDGASGAELWRTEIAGTGDFSDVVSSVAVDGAGNAIAGGRLSNSGTFDDIMVVKLDGASGAELWRAEIIGTANGADNVSSVAVDAGGDVIAGGFISNSGTGFGDFAVVKLDGANGAELWRTGIDGTANFDDQVRSVAVDAGGNVIAGGVIRNSETGADFAVVKLDGADGSELIGTPPFLIAGLVDTVVDLNLQMGIANSLDAKLGAVESALDDVNTNNDVAAINALQAFINAITAQSGDKIGEADAAALIAAAEQIIALLSGG